MEDSVAVDATNQLGYNKQLISTVVGEIEQANSNPRNAEKMKIYNSDIVWSCEDVARSVEKSDCVKDEVGPDSSAK